MILAAWAGTPKIEFDKTVVDCGKVLDGKTEEVHATFTVKNPGDAPLRLLTVSPRCGCTGVVFDSIVMPGETKKIEASMNVSRYHSGVISKQIAITSNAVNTPSIKLTISATIDPVIEASEQFVNFELSKQGNVHRLFLASMKKDLSVTSVEFRQNGMEDAAWKQQVPLSIKFVWTPQDSVRKDGFRVFKLELTVPPVTDPLTGTISIRTNHPDKSVVPVECTFIK
jgi:hypothetical protein